MYALIRLADFFNVSLDYLVGRSDVSVQSNKDLVREIERIQDELDEVKCMLLR